MASVLVATKSREVLVLQREAVGSWAALLGWLAQVTAEFTHVRCSELTWGRNQHNLIMFLS